MVCPLWVTVGHQIDAQLRLTKDTTNLTCDSWIIAVSKVQYPWKLWRPCRPEDPQKYPNCRSCKSVAYLNSRNQCDSHKLLPVQQNLQILNLPVHPLYCQPGAKEHLQVFVETESGENICITTKLYINWTLTQLILPLRDSKWRKYLRNNQTVHWLGIDPTHPPISMVVLATLMSNLRPNNGPGPTLDQCFFCMSATFKCGTCGR